MRINSYLTSGSIKCVVCLNPFTIHTEEPMFRQFFAGFTVSLCNIVIHALVMTAVVRVIHIEAVRHRLTPTTHMVAVMIATVAVLMMAHASEVIVWSLAYASHRCRAGRGRCCLFCVRKLHDAGIWRCRSCGALAADWTYDSDERSARVRLVHRRHLRGAA
jgi:hypothetical protein